MATKQKQAQRHSIFGVERAHRMSHGTAIGARKNPQDGLTLVILGKGQYKTWTGIIGGKGRFGQADLSTFGSFDMEQALTNRAAGLC